MGRATLFLGAAILFGTAGSLEAQFAPASSYPSNNPLEIDAGDLDGDGLVDLITANATAECWTYLNGPPGSFTPGPVLPQPGNVVDVMIADFDGALGLDYVAVLTPTEIAVHLNSGFLTYAPPTLYTVAGNAIEVEVADFDLDGDVDIAVLSQNSPSGTLTVLRNDGTGSFATAWSTTTALTPTGFGVGNVNSRHGKDLIYVGGTNTVSVLLKSGGSGMGFGPEIPFVCDIRPTDVTTADLDGDGNQDLAISQGLVTASVLLNRGACAGGFPFSVDFFPYVPYTIPGTNAYFAVDSEDFDCDGDLDLVLASPGFALVGVLFNDGTGTFGPWTTHPTGTLCTDVVAADFDGRNPDAASANVNDVSVLINTNPWGVCEHTFIGGIVDDYVDPLPFTTEDACPSITLTTFVGPLPMRPFDGPPSCNRIFLHSFQNLPDNILAGTLEVRLRAPCWASNDSLAIGLDSGCAQYTWARRISSLSGLPWTAGDETILTFDLSSLPGGVDLLRKMDVDGRLDFRVQDDTMVDSITLKLTTCGDLRGTVPLKVSPLVVGTTVDMNVSGVPPGAIVIYFMDTAVGPGPSLLLWGSLCLPTPSFWGWDVANGAGEATSSFTMFPALPCTNWSFQAISISSPPPLVLFSNTVTQQAFQ